MNKYKGITLRQISDIMADSECAVTLKENKEKCFLVFRDIIIIVKLSDGES